MEDGACSPALAQLDSWVPVICQPPSSLAMALILPAVLVVTSISCLCNDVQGCSLHSVLFFAKLCTSQLAQTDLT